MNMNTNVVANIETSIYALPLDEQRRLIVRVSKALRERSRSHIDSELEAMANDPFVQKELKEINAEFGVAEFDGLAE